MARCPVPLLLVPLAAGCLPSLFEEALTLTSLSAFLLHVPDPRAEFGVETEGGASVQAEAYLVRAGLLGGEGAVSGATVDLVLPDGTAVPLLEVEPGRYRATTADGAPLFYVPGGWYEVRARVDGQVLTAGGEACPATTIVSPEAGTEVAAGTDLDVGMGQAADTAVVMLFDQEGNAAYDSIPDDIEGLASFLLGEAGHEHRIPGQYLDQEGIWVLGAAALAREAWSSTSEGLDAGVSRFVTGGADLVAVSTMPLESMGGLLLSLEPSGLEAWGFTGGSHVQAMLYGSRMVLSGEVGEEGIQGGQTTVAWSGGTVDLPESPETPGLYEADSGSRPGLAYQPGETYTFTLAGREEAWSLSMVAPVAPPLAGPPPGARHDPEKELVLDTPESHDVFFAVVLDGTGAVTWSDLPEEDDVDAVLAGELGTPPGSAIAIPSRAFHGGPVFAVGLVGLEAMDTRGCPAGLNCSLSMLYAGSSTFTVVATEAR